MITIDENLYVDQWCESPTVYLDHWAWRKISESEPLSERFVTALKSREGTVALSWLNIIEFSKLTDENQARKADDLLEECLPRIFLINPDFFTVIDEEDKLGNGGEPVAPHADIETFRFFAKHNFSKQESLKLFPSQNLFRIATETPVVSRFDILADYITGKLESLRKDYQEKREFRLMVNRLPKKPHVQCGTRYLARELIRHILASKTLKITRNHAIDLCHAVVAIAYCDFVLLDNHWATQVEQARKRIREGGMSFPIAKVFSERADGIGQFFDQLDQG